jgi:SAM-dependent methyltransferase
MSSKRDGLTMADPSRATASGSWLDRVYHAPDAAELTKTYDTWTATYDSDMLTIGYANPAVAVGLVSRHVRDVGDPILDAGVGTGVVGELLSILGYENLAGIDMSEGMLAKARARNVYADLRNRVLGEALDFPDGAFAAIVCFGVFTPGHAPPAAFDELVRVTRPGGRLIFTVSTAAWKEAGFEAKLAALERAGRIALVEATGLHRPMPLSVAEASFTTRAYVYAVS